MRQGSLGRSITERSMTEGRIVGGAWQGGGWHGGAWKEKAVYPTVENAQTNNKTELFQSKYCGKSKAFPEPFKKKITELEKRVSL